MLILCITLFTYAATTIRLCPFHPQDTLTCNSFLTLGQHYQPSVNNVEGNCVGITIRVVKQQPGPEVPWIKHQMTTHLALTHNGRNRGGLA